VFGFRFIKFSPTTYVLEYSGGAVKREGAGLAFFYFAPITTLVTVPVDSTDVPFIFTEVTADFQEVTVQGTLTFRITDPKRIAALLDFSLDRTGKKYASEDPKLLELRVLNALQAEVNRQIGKADLRAALQATSTFTKSELTALWQVPDLQSLGIEVLSLAIVAIKPQPETARALEADARELLLKNADLAIYSRRNAAIEPEPAIRENELNTEIAVENQKRQIREEQLKAERFELEECLRVWLPGIVFAETEER
jgi:regulator of protease activity HflC (stomatin/prohibitin superfamily)